MVLANYQPQEVFKHFEAISQIPRGSGNEKAVSDYIAKFATDLGYKTIQDNWNNLVIFKPGTAGHEGKPPIILQAHLDMVCEKNADTVHNFVTDSLKLYVDGDFILAKGTTLGADNGLGVAFCMALLESTDIDHPPLEIILTTEEETGMAGAINLDTSVLKAKRMINFDNSREKEFILGCASGSVMEYLLPGDWDAVTPDNVAYSISVKGLTGGHSGGDIHRERGNALRIMGNILAGVNVQVGVRIACISGGMMVNAIPREAVATIVLPKNEADKVLGILEQCRANLAEEYRATDSDLVVSWTQDSVGKALTANCSGKLIASLTLLPYGVQQMSVEMEGLVNASCNIGVIETMHEGVKISLMARAASRSHTERMEMQINNLANLTGAQVTVLRRTPPWPYNPNSGLLKVAAECYKPVFKRDAELKAIHGGLECGVFLEKIPELDIIAIGPTTIDLHTPQERLSISSTEKMWEFLQLLLKVV